MKFLYYDLAFLLVFCLSMAFLFLRNKKNVKIESKIFILYKTKVGLKLINWLGSRCKKIFKIGSYVVIVIGYILMIAALFFFSQMLISVIKMPELFKVIKVPPIMPLIPYLPQIFNIEFLPPFYFTYWIVAIAIIALFHEGAHGVFAKFYKVKIKSTGFGFLGPFLAAFVEPDEKQLAKKSKKAQLAVLSAGSFANFVIAILFIVIIALFFYCFFLPEGVQFETYVSSVINVSNITAISNIPLSNPNIQDIATALNNLNFVDLKIKINNRTINLTKITTENETYFAVTESLKAQIKKAGKTKTEIKQLLVFDDTPALRVGLQGAIIKINYVEVKNLSEFENELSKYKPNDEVIIEVINKSYEKEYYKLRLAERPDNKSRAFLGVGFVDIKPRGIFSFIGRVIARFKNPSIFYMPKYSVVLTIFIYNLLWWIIMINLSVAIVNMLPLGIFDGGRVFYLTMIAITKSKKIAAKIFKLVTCILLGLVLLLTMLWWIAV